jgi:hypothetical protein
VFFVVHSFFASQHLGVFALILFHRVPHNLQLHQLGDGRFYDRMIPLADKLMDEHLREIEKEDKS